MAKQLYCEKYKKLDNLRACCLPYVVAISQTPSPEQNPNSLLPVNASNAQDAIN